MKSPKQTARLAGLLYLLLAITGIYGLMYVPSEIYIQNDIQSTADNIRTSELTLRSGIVANILGQISFLFLGVFLYRLLKPVNKFTAQIMLILIAVSIPVSFTGFIAQLGSIIPQNDILNLENADQLSYFFSELYQQSIAVVVIFWGLWLIPFGLLVYRSGFLPKIIGVFLIIGGVTYVIDFATQLYDFKSESLSVILSSFASIGEFSILFWLLIKGVNTNNYPTRIEEVTQ